MIALGLPSVHSAPVLGAGLRELFLRTPLVSMANPCHAHGVGCPAMKGQWSSALPSAQGAHSCLRQEAQRVHQPAGSVQGTLHLTFRSIYN